MTPAPLARFIALRDEFIRKAPPEPGSALCRSLSDGLDVAIASSVPADAAEVSVLAVGGYGRRELCLRSDVDLLVLCEAAPPTALIDAVLYPLWDAGLKVGHAVRTVPEAVSAAGERVETLTATLTGRLVAGSPALHSRLIDGLAKLLKRQLPGLRATLRQAEEARRAAEPFQLQEANVKHARGGLRTLHSLLWLGGAEALASGNPLAAAEYAIGDLDGVLDTLLATRNALHAVAGRAQDTWLFDLQPAACAWLAVDLDGWARRLYLAMRAVDRRAEEALGPVPVSDSVAREPRPLAWLRPRRGAPKPDSEAAQHVARQTSTRPGGLTGAASRSVFERARRLVLDGSQPPFFSDEEQTLIAAAHGPTWSEADRRDLLALLRAGERGRRIFDELDRLGWLERALPEWRHVRGAPQRVPFHSHPVDVHLWRTVIEALHLAEGRTEDPWARRVALDLGSLDDLLLAALLHDIGKGWPGDHAETGAVTAAALCRRARFDPETALTVTEAVRHHLLLPVVATRRDIADARVVHDVASRAGRVRTLQILYLLSIADSRATGPGMWSPWKASLVGTLFGAALRVLDRRSDATPLVQSTADDLDTLLAFAGSTAEEQAVHRHVAIMAPGYLRSFSPADVLRHKRLMDSPPAVGDVRLDARSDGAMGDLALATPDRPGLIALVSGVLALHNFSVLDGRFFTRDDGVALQALAVADALSRPIDAKRWLDVERDLSLALAGKLPLERRLAEKRHAYRRAGSSRQQAEVRIVPDISDKYTVVELQAADRVGLLHDITWALFRLGLDVHLAKIDTQGRGVVDTFYLRDAAGLPLKDGQQLAALRSALLSAAGE